MKKSPTVTILFTIVIVLTLAAVSYLITNGFVPIHQSEIVNDISRDAQLMLFADHLGFIAYCISRYLRQYLINFVVLLGGAILIFGGISLWVRSYAQRQAKRQKGS